MSEVEMFAIGGVKKIDTPAPIEPANELIELKVGLERHHLVRLLP